MRVGLPWLVAGLGTLLALVGLAVVLASEAEAEPEVVYDASYAPLDTETLDAYQSVLELTYDGTVTWTVAEVVGGGLLVIGLLLLSAIGGWVIGRRTRPAA